MVHAVVLCGGRTAGCDVTIFGRRRRGLLLAALSSVNSSWEAPGDERVAGACYVMVGRFHLFHAEKGPHLLGPQTSITHLHLVRCSRLHGNSISASLSEQRIARFKYSQHHAKSNEVR